MLTRPFFLLGGALLYALGAALAISAGASIEWGRYALGQLLVTSIQLMTHYANEYFDQESDRLVGANRTWFSGGSGILPGGRLAPSVALNAARACALIAGVLALGLLAVEPAMSVVGALALLGGWFYSAPPLRLVASGLGEVTTTLIVAVLAPLGGLIMQRSPVDARWIAIAFPLVLAHIAMLIAFEFPDRDADRAAGKRTLAVRLGDGRAARLHGALIVVAFVAVWVAAGAGWIGQHIAGWTLTLVPLAAWQIANLIRHARLDAGRMASVTTGGVALFGLMSAMFLVGVLVQ